MPRQTQGKLRDPGLHKMATEQQGCSRRGYHPPKSLLGSIALTQAGTLTGGDLANRVFGPILGHPLPFGRAVVTGVGAGGDNGELPCRESTMMPRLGALVIP